MAFCSFLTALLHPRHCLSASSFKPHHWSCQTVLKAILHIRASISLPLDLLMFTFSSCTSAFCLWLRTSQALLTGCEKDFSGNRAMYGSFSVLFLHDAFHAASVCIHVVKVLLYGISVVIGQSLDFLNNLIPWFIVSKYKQECSCLLKK